jgi:large subunit ribosomal protein L29
MEASELRNFSVDDLKGRIRQWREELFQSKFKSQSSETKDTSVLKKLRKDIARGMTVLNEKVKETAVETASAVKSEAVKAKPAEAHEAPEVEAAPSDKPAGAKTKRAKVSKGKGVKK